MKKPSEKRECAFCKNVFDTKHYSQIYCSYDCYYSELLRKATLKKNKRIPTEKVCVREACGKHFIPTLRNQTYCSFECQGLNAPILRAERRARNKKTTLKCASPECGKEFIRGGPRSLYCSTECAAREQKKNIREFYIRKNYELMNGDKVKGKVTSITQEIQIAKEAGLSYGMAKLKGII